MAKAKAIEMDRGEGKTAEMEGFAEQVEREFMRLYEKYGAAVAPERRRADIIDSFWPEIYNIVFKPDIDDIRYNNQLSKLKTYKIYDVESVCDMYIKLCKRYGGVIKFNQFCNLTGISKNTIWFWHKQNKENGYIFHLDNKGIEEEGINYTIYINANDVVNYSGNMRDNINDKTTHIRYDIYKKLQEEMQDSNTNGLSNDTMGHALRANNEPELGKLYEPRRMVQQEQIRQQPQSAAQIAARYGLELSDNSRKSDE